MAKNQDQLTPEELKELIKLYQTINNLNKLDAEAAAKKAVANKKAKEELEKMQDIMNDYVNNIGYAEVQFQKMVDNVRGYNSSVGKAASQFDKLKGIAAKIYDIQSGTVSVNEKDLQKLREKLDSERNRFKTIKIGLEDQLKTQIKGTKEYYKTEKTLAAVNKILSDNNVEYEAMIGAIEQEEKSLANVKEALGVTGALMKSMSKVPFLGDLPGMKESLGKVEEKIKKIEKEEGRVVSKAEALKMAIEETGPSITKNLLDPMTGLTAVFKVVWGVIKDVDKGTGELAKSMNMSYKSSLEFKNQFTDIATNSRDVSLNTKNLQASYIAIGQALGANADINEEDLKTFTKLREQAGYTNEELMGMYKISLTTGKSVKEVTSEFLGGAEALSAQKGLSINVKQLMKETANTSAAIRLSLGGSGKALAEAAVKAKELGINLDQADKIAGSLLNFEDSISAELEAELLTGKQINLETARLAALNGDIGTMAEEINSQIGGSAEFTKMNRIQQEAYANAVGMSREELANSLVEQEALQRVGAKTAEEAKKRYDDLRSKGLTAEQAAVELGDAQLAQQFEQQSNAEKFQQAIEKLKDLLVDLVNGPLNSILGMFSSLADNAGLIYTLFGAIAGLMTGKMVLGLAAQLPKMAQLLAFATGRAAAEVTAAEAATLGLATVGILAGLGAIMGAMYAASEPKNVQDAQIASDGGLMVSGPKGTFQLDKDDTVIAGTDLNKKGSSSNQSSSNVIVKGGETSLTINGEVFARLVTPFIVEELNKRNMLIQ
jgi:hypothetical protein